MLNIGLTGGIASGKSVVGRILASMGARVVDSDAVARDVYRRGEPGFAVVHQAFGDQVLGSDGDIDRAALGVLVFGDATRLKQLTDIVWPLARRRVEEAQSEAERDGVQVFVVEAPFLIEAAWQDLVDEVWLVRTPRELARERLIQQRGMSEADADARLDARPDDEVRLPHADVVIENAGDLDALESAVKAAWETALRRARE